MFDMTREIWEGWSPIKFIDYIEPELDMVMSGKSFRKPLKTKKELAFYTASAQPYYKKVIPEVVEYFAEKYGLD